MIQTSLYENRHSLRGLAVGALAGLSILMTGCASTPAPVEQMALSRSAVSNAMALGGNEFAPVEMKSALDKMEVAEKAMVAKNYDLAKEKAEQAEVDAKLAGAKARSTKAKKAADALQDDIRVLRQEIERNAK